MSVPRVTLAPGYEISRLLKGGWQLAGGHGQVSEADALADMAAFVDAGITTFDCADIYTGVESLIGAFLRRLRTERGASAASDVQVHTKCVPDLDRLPGLRRRDLESIVDRSLTRLGVEVLDLVQLHWWDYRIPGYVQAAVWLDDLRQAGKLRRVGLTNFDCPRVAEVLAAGVPVVSHQVQYSVLDRRPMSGMAALCRERGIQMLAYGALAGGFLSERWLGRPGPVEPLHNRSLVKYRLVIEECGGWLRFQVLLAVLAQIARRHGVGIGAVAIRWVLDRAGVAGVIVGARDASHLPGIVEAAGLALDDYDDALIAAAQTEVPSPGGDVYEMERVPEGRHAAIMRYNLNRGG